MINKKYIIAILAVLVAGLLSYFTMFRAAPVVTPALEGDNVNTADTFSNGLTVGNVTEGAISLTIGARRNQASWRNVTDKPVYVYYAMVATDGVASSSYTMYVATSSTQTIASDYTAPFASLINGTVIATSSVATTTSNLDNPRSTRVIKVPVGQYVVAQLQSTFDCTVSGGGICESATSSNRGFNLKAVLKYHD